MTSSDGGDVSNPAGAGALDLTAWMQGKLVAGMRAAASGKGLHLIEIDLLIGVDGYAMQGQTELERYLAKVAALDVWVAAHPDLESL